MRPWWKEERTFGSRVSGLIEGASRQVPEIPLGDTPHRGYLSDCHGSVSTTALFFNNFQQFRTSFNLFLFLSSMAFTKSYSSDSELADDFIDISPVGNGSHEGGPQTRPLPNAKDFYGQWVEQCKILSTIAVVFNISDL